MNFWLSEFVPARKKKNIVNDIQTKSGNKFYFQIYFSCNKTNIQRSGAKKSIWMMCEWNTFNFWCLLIISMKSRDFHLTSQSQKVCYDSKYPYKVGVLFVMPYTAYTGSFVMYFYQLTVNYLKSQRTFHLHTSVRRLVMYICLWKFLFIFAKKAIC